MNKRTDSKRRGRSRARVRQKSPDLRISGDLTNSLITQLNEILDRDYTPRSMYLKSEWLSKFCDADAKSAKQRQQLAIEKWLSVDTHNAITARRISSYGLSDQVCVLPGITASRFTRKVREYVDAVVGQEPSLDLTYGGFSSGASTSKQRARSFQAVKYQEKADISRRALPIFRDMIRGTIFEGYNNFDLEPRLVDYNVLFTVPKTSTIDRVAAKEPDLNMYLQKLLGDQIRYLLRRKGIDLNNQETNGQLAREGSIYGNLATIDLSSASDSVTTELVKLMMPDAWFYYLDSFRSSRTLVPGTNTLFEPHMFSSMGNGFTFELESLLFYSIVRAACTFTGSSGRISVYGDDIICPSQAYDAVVSALSFYGFRTNDKKSFYEGPFRESCGAHWHDGHDIKPFYLRGPIRTVSDLIHFTNQLIRWSCDGQGVVDPRFNEIIDFCLARIPESFHGGRDFDSRGAVVTPDKPRKELYWKTKKLSVHAWYGAYLWALDRMYKAPHGGALEPSQPIGLEVKVRSQWVRCGFLDGKPIYCLRTRREDNIIFIR